MAYLEEVEQARRLKGGSFEVVQQIFGRNPTVDVNQEDSNSLRWTILAHSVTGKKDDVFRLLLSHPDIDPNTKDGLGYTAFDWACAFENLPALKMMLHDSRVRLGSTALRNAVLQGRLNVVGWWMASGREMDFGQGGDLVQLATDNLGKDLSVPVWNQLRIVSLLENFEKNPWSARAEVRRELEIDGEKLLTFLLFVPADLFLGMNPQIF